MGTSNILLERTKNSKMTLQLVDHRPPARTTPASESDPLEALRLELDGYRAEMCSLQTYKSDPREVFMRLSAWHARANVIRATTYQSESRRATAFRSHEVDPFVDACEFQFKTWSRIHAITEAEIRLSRGGI